MRVRKRVCILLIGAQAARECVSARARGHDDFGKHGGSYRPMAARLLAGRATAIRDDEERGSEIGRRERMTGRDDGSGGERTGFATSNNECLLPPAKPSFSLLQSADSSSRVVFLPFALDRTPSFVGFLTRFKRKETRRPTNLHKGTEPV